MTCIREEEEEEEVPVEGHLAAYDAVVVCQLQCDILCQVSSDVSCLREIASVISDSDVSSFEIIHSGLISKLVSYLTVHDQSSCRNDRLRVFLHVFASCPVCRLVTAITDTEVFTKLSNANNSYNRFVYENFSVGDNVVYHNLSRVLYLSCKHNIRAED